LHQQVEFGTMLVDRSTTDTARRASITSISSRCHVLPGLRRAALAQCANRAPNLSHQQRIVSYVTTTPRSSHSSSMSQAQAEPEIPANRAADDDGWEAGTVIKRFRFLHHFILPPPR
jgi:hypothetical protein